MARSLVLPVDVKRRIPIDSEPTLRIHGKLKVADDRIEIPGLGNGDVLLAGDKYLMQQQQQPLAVGLIESGNQGFFCMNLKYARGKYTLVQNEVNAAYSFRNGSSFYVFSYRDEYDGLCFILVHP